MRNTLDALLGQVVLRDVGYHVKAAHDLLLVPDMRQEFDLQITRFTILEPAGTSVSDRIPLQYLHKMAFELPIHLLPQDDPHVLADNVLEPEELGKDLVGEAATQILVPGDGHGRNVVGEQAQL